MENKKRCSKCKEWKSFDCFCKDKSRKDGISYECKECRSRYAEIYYKNNKPTVLKRNNQYYENNTPEILKQKQEYYEENRPEILKQHQENYNKNKSIRLKQNKKHKKSLIKFNSDTKVRKEIELYEEEIRKSKDGYLECKCTYCGDWFTPTYRNISSRINAMNNKNKGEGRLYCSKACKQACPTYGQKLYPKGFKPVTSREVQPELRQMVLLRDDYTCQRCNKTKEELSEECIALHCHHLEGILWEPLQSADIDMCITYCQPCHVKAHQGPDCGNNDMQCTDIWKE